METERWAALKSAFEELLRLPPEERGARLEELESAEPGFREQLMRLLEADASADRRLRPVELPSPPAAQAAVPDPFDLSGRRVSHFEVQDVLGCGGMGVVYRAADLVLGRTVALKFLLPQYGLDAIAKERFLLEARAASALDHPHICTIHEAGEADRGRLFLAMSCYKGETLRERLAREGALPLDAALELARQVASGLDAAHAASIVHRDLKPGNLMLTAEGTLKILDFGVAKVRDLSLTGSGLRPGTVAYMSPEQLRSERVDARTDLWSLGVVLYEILTGAMPFGGGHELSTVYRILHEEPRAPSELRPEIPAALEELMLRLLRKQPAERYASAAEVLRALEVLDPGTSGALSGVPSEPSPPDVPRSRFGTVRSLAGARRPHRLVLGSVLVLGALILGERLLPWFADHAPVATGTLLSRGVLAERERILLADFTSPSGDSVEAVVASVAFRIDLAQSPVLTLVEPQQVREALARMQRSDARALGLELARELAVREGIKAVLAGEVIRSGSGYLLSAHLFAAESGEVLTAGRQVAADSTELLPALDRLSKQLRRGIGESLRSVRSNPPLERVTTASLDALRKYSRALQALDVEGADTRGIALLEEAVALDTTFAMAYRRLGEALVTRGDERARWIDAFTRAYRHRDRLTSRERYLSQASYYRRVAGEREKAIESLHTLLHSYPNDLAALGTLAVLYLQFRDWARSEAYHHRAWAVDSSAWIGLNNQIMAQFNQGKYAEAEATLQRFRERFPGNWRVANRAIEMAAARGEYARAESLALAERQAWPEDLWRQALLATRLADVAETRGRVEQARRYWQEQSEIHRRRGQRDRAFHSLMEVAHLDASYQPARVPEQVRRALELYPLEEMRVTDRPYLFLARILAQSGYPDQARAVLAAWEVAEPENQRGHGSWVRHRAYGLIALAEGRYQDAIHQFRLYNHQDVRATYGLPDLALAYDRAAQPDSAIAIYERYLRTPDLERLYRDAFSRGPALERLGQLYEARGEHTEAAEHYAAFIELWKDADPELQPRVREARRRLAGLRGG